MYIRRRRGCALILPIGIKIGFVEAEKMNECVGCLRYGC